MDFEAIKLLMAGRAALYGLLADSFENNLDLSSIYNLCKYLFDLDESVEAVDEEDELFQGSKGLQDWYSNAYSIIEKSEDKKQAKEWLESKLATEYKYIFLDSALKVTFDSANLDEIKATYSNENYSAEGEANSISELLSFLSFLSVEASKKESLEAMDAPLKAQLQFLNSYIYADISSFVEALYNISPDYGIYRYIALILHGFIMLDNAIIGALINNKSGLRTV